MKTDDISRFKGQLKGALQQWGEKKIDEMMPTKPQMRTLLKRGLGNMMARWDEKINKYVETLFLFTANEQGVIDTDTMVEMAADMFKELEPRKYQFDMFDIEIGRGELAIYLPDNILYDLLLGGSGRFRMTVDDILEMKQYFN